MPFTPVLLGDGELVLRVAGMGEEDEARAFEVLAECHEREGGDEESPIGNRYTGRKGGGGAFFVYRSSSGWRA